MRETLFNWLQERVAGARCLDLYAGSGALGLEALSRGAAGVVFVEQQRRAAQGLEELLREWQHEPAPAPLGSWQVICGQALQFLAGNATAGSAIVGDALAGNAIVGNARVGEARVHARSHARYDIVFLDPPFASGELAAATAALERGGWLAPQARIYVEHARATALPALPEGWHELRASHAGEVGYHLFTPAASAGAGEGQP